jgi:hypothetical protein
MYKLLDWAVCCVTLSGIAMAVARASGQRSFSPFDENFRVKPFQAVLQDHPRFKDVRKNAHVKLTGSLHA